MARGVPVGGVAQQIEGATFREMKELGHFPMSENPELFLSYVEPVLSAPRIVVVGRSPMAQALADMAAAR